MADSVVDTSSFVPASIGIREEVAIRIANGCSSTARIPRCDQMRQVLTTDLTGSTDPADSNHLPAHLSSAHRSKATGPTNGYTQNIRLRTQSINELINPNSTSDNPRFPALSPTQWALSPTRVGVVSNSITSICAPVQCFVEPVWSMNKRDWLSELDFLAPI